MGLGRAAATAIGFGAALVLPYYGAEVFGVGAVGRRAVDAADPGLVGLVDDIRFAGPAVALLGAGVALLAIGGLIAGPTLWGSQRAAGILLTVRLVLYLPQFYFSPALRVAHGAALGLAMILLTLHQVRVRRPAELD